MNNGYQQEEKELLLIDYIYRVLSHWRSIIVAMVICAVALGGLKYFKDTKELKAQIQAQENFDPEVQMNVMMSQLNDKEKRAVESVLRFEKIKTEREEYIDTATVMKMDRSAVDESILQYHIETEGNTTELLNAYKLNYLTDDVMQEIAKISDNMDTKDVKTMISASCDEKKVLHFGNENTFIFDEDDSLYESFYITVRGFSKDEVMSMSEIVKRAVSDYSKKAQGVYGTHKIILANEVYQKCMDEYVGNIQDSTYSQVIDLQSKIDTLMKSFSDAQNNIINFYIKYMTQETDEVINGNMNEHASINVKWILVGTFFGACVIAGWQLLIWVLGGQVNSPEELNRNYEIYNFGIYNNKERENNHRLFSGIDHLIYHLCYRGRPKLTPEESFSIILSGIVEKCKSENVERLYLTNLGNNDDFNDDLTRTFCEKLIKSAEVEGVLLSMGENPCANARGLLHMTQYDHVVLCDKIENVKHSDYIRLLQMCKEYNVHVMGTVFIA